MNKINLTFNLWAVALVLFVALYMLAIKQEKEAKIIMKENKQAQSELFSLRQEYLGKTGLSAYNQGSSNLSAPKDIIYIKKSELPVTKTDKDKNHGVSFEVLGL